MSASKANCKRHTSGSSKIQLYLLTSSANNLTLILCCLSTSSLMYVKNINGPMPLP